MPVGRRRRSGLGWSGLPVVALLVATASGADVLETRDGRILQGTYLGGTQQAVRFQVGGDVQVLPRDEVLALTFVPGSVARPAASPAPPAPDAGGAEPSPAGTASTRVTPAATAPPAASPPAPPAPALARVPAGTRLQVRIVGGVDARLAAAGDPFTATLENGLGIDGRAVVPAGSTLHGRIADVRDVAPADPQLKLELTALILEGQRVELVTGPQTVARAPAAPGGPAAAAQSEGRPGIPAGSVLEFRLLQPIDLRIQ